MKKLYVGNLPFQATEEQLSALFTQTGVTAANVTLVRDRFSGQPRGFGFVEVNSDEEAERAIQGLNGHDFMGRNIVVNEARPPREGGGGGGGGRPGGGGGGGRRWGEAEDDRAAVVVAAAAVGEAGGRDRGDRGGGWRRRPPLVIRKKNKNLPNRETGGLALYLVRICFLIIQEI